MDLEEQQRINKEKEAKKKKDREERNKKTKKQYKLDKWNSICKRNCKTWS